MANSASLRLVLTVPQSHRRVARYIDYARGGVPEVIRFLRKSVAVDGSTMASQHIPVTGGCLCGAVRYESNAPPVEGFYCHCTTCQKNYGGLFQATLKFTGSTFQFTNGELKYYRASNFAKRGFCAECGSPIAFIYEGNPNVWILIGSLDHPEDWPLIKNAPWGQSGHWYIETKVPWFDIVDGLPQHSEAPGAVAAQRYAGSSSRNDRP